LKPPVVGRPLLGDAGFGGGRCGAKRRATDGRTKANDVISVLEPILARKPDRATTPAGEPAENERGRIVSLLGPTPIAIDDLVRLSQTSPAIVRTVLLELEIAGRLERPGGALVSLV
jgi:DNA processing protein